MEDSNGSPYVEIPEYPDDPFWRIGTLHLARGSGEPQVGEVVRHGRRPDVHMQFAELVDLSELTGIPLGDGDYEILVLGEGPVLRFHDGEEVFFCGMATSSLAAITGEDPITLHRSKED